MAIRASSTVVGMSFALFLLSGPAAAGHVQSWLDSRGGCSPGPLQLMDFHPPRGLREFLGKQAQAWTDEDVEEFQRVYSACVKQHAVFATGVVNPTASQIEATISGAVDRLRQRFIEPARQEARAQTAKLAAERRLAEEREASEEQRQVRLEQEAREKAAEADQRAAERADRDRERAREQSERERRATEEREAREEQQKEKLAQEDRENAAAATRLATERAERTRQRLQDQAEQDRRKTEELLKQVEAEERRTAEVAREAEEARQARAAAERRLAEIRRKSESVEQQRHERTEDTTPRPGMSPEEGQPAATLDLIAADFSKKFNDMSASLGFDLRASNNGCSAAVRTACQFKIREHTGVVASAGNNDPHATEVMVIHSLTDDPSEVMQALSSFMVVAKLLSPSLRREKDNRFVSMMFLGLKEKSESKATADRVHYTMTKNSVGLWFSASAYNP
jgi:hypothetical protein